VIWSWTVALAEEGVMALWVDTTLAMFPSLVVAEETLEAEGRVADLAVEGKVVDLAVEGKVEEVPATWVGTTLAKIASLVVEALAAAEG
jgi:hypothetical protein